jgi:hypothetical protein
MYNPFNPHIIKTNYEEEYRIRKFTLRGWKYLWITEECPSYEWGTTLIGNDFNSLEEAEKAYSLTFVKHEHKTKFIKYL